MVAELSDAECRNRIVDTVHSLTFGRGLPLTETIPRAQRRPDRPFDEPFRCDNGVPGFLLSLIVYTALPRACADCEIQYDLNGRDTGGHIVAGGAGGRGVACSHGKGTWTRGRLILTIEELAKLSQLQVVRAIPFPMVVSFTTPIGGEIISRLKTDEMGDYWEALAHWPVSPVDLGNGADCRVECSLTEGIPHYVLGQEAWETRRRLVEKAETEHLGTNSPKTDKSPQNILIQLCQTTVNVSMRKEPEKSPAATSDDQGNHMPSQSDPPPRSAPASRRPRRGGRPRLSVAESEKRRSIVAEWNQAKTAGVSQKDFCADKRISLTDLEKYINWVAQRKRRHDSP